MENITGGGSAISARELLSQPAYAEEFVRDHQDVKERDRALSELWGHDDVARYEYAWEVIARPTASTADLAIIGANNDIPVLVLLRHPSADHELIGLIFDRMKYRETRPPKWERTYWYWVNRSHR